MRVLRYVGFDDSGPTAVCGPLIDALAVGNFRSAQVKKLTGHRGLYRAKINRADRLVFPLIRHRHETCILLLEVLRNHDYPKSRFLRGADIDEDRLPDVFDLEERTETLPVRYLHAEKTEVHYLDKPLSFDEAQDAVFRTPPPLVIVGGAGSGKTALALEKLKQVPGKVLYVTHSAFLALHARDLYFGAGFEREDQEIEFLSYREFLESIRVPQGREGVYKDFSDWFARMRQAFREIDPHQAYEEMRGVIAADPSGTLDRGQYLRLGVRQSIFPEDRRNRVYDLFEKYRGHLAENGLFDTSLLAQTWKDLAAPSYDFVAVDEVQDLTAAQLRVVLGTLQTSGRFILCGDSNQIVHPNFFSWSRVKSLFWNAPALADRQKLNLLDTNFRNGEAVTRLANTLIKIKHRRFGSVDRESNFLVKTVGGVTGQTILLPDAETVTRDLDGRTRRSTQFAVLVLREEDKAEARQRFSTPLLFSVQEAKGLEYPNIILFRCVSGYRREFSEIAQGVSSEDIAQDSLEYSRARDKNDKSLEVYKFFVNALYVGITRAVEGLWIVESDLEHPLLRLLGLSPSAEVRVESDRSSLEDWQREARRLELHGKQEQAAEIRRTFLKTAEVPWKVFDEIRVRNALKAVFEDKAPGDKQKQQLLEWAAIHDEPVLAERLSREAGFIPALNFENARRDLSRRHFSKYATNFFKDVLRECEMYGFEHRTQANLTPLMEACAAGNPGLVEALLGRGADPETTDHFGRSALHWALRSAFSNPDYARGAFSEIYERIAPSYVDVQANGRLVRIDRRQSEYLLFQTFWALTKDQFAGAHNGPGGALSAETVRKAFEHFPPGVLRPERKRRAHISAVLARNEVNRDYAYNRRLFQRPLHGWYWLSPALEIRIRNSGGDSWTPLCSALNFPFIKEFTFQYYRRDLESFLNAGERLKPKISRP